ncbi:hypothetical protein [Heyndrickxia sporothermodurans]|uniref:hypothetical protein n=1 Tax=Heyndrickxia sporothermodurans TaxID=46224 RepID=UPI000D3A15A7|nr:hypothetical protein [Heyndrickxia sporothermodurans]PTY93031.1 hypothetical protein B5V90_02810 [Heyndrickxia sporothermodurans]
MGMYTGLRCKVVIKPEYREAMKQLVDNEYEWSESDVDFFKEYGDVSRATFIPRGALAYMPGEWEGPPFGKFGDGVPTDGFDRKFDPETGLWTFQCSLKNYEDTIETFMENVLARIAEKVIHLEYYYEEWDKSIMYDIVDGKVVELKGQGRTYVDEDPEANDYGL